MENENQKGYEDYFHALEKSLKNNDSHKGKEIIARPKHNNRRKKSSKAPVIKTIAVLISIAIILTIIFSVKSCNSPKKQETDKPKSHISAQKAKQEPKTVSLVPSYDNEEALSSEINSEAVIFIDDETNEVITSRNTDKRMFPASTTKIMTLLVAVENITDYTDTFKMTYQITDPLFKEGATVAGFSAGEEINMYDLIYGTILPSGGDAAIGLAEKISGSEEEFVKLMNKKAEELNLNDTNFTNCTGLYNANHYTTAQDLSVVLRTAMRNDICKKVLSTQKYTTSKTSQHPEGLELENTLFKYMYGTEPTGATIIGGKTGFVNESGYCIASFGESSSGKTYACVALNGESRWPAVYDQINLYSKYIK